MEKIYLLLFFISITFLIMVFELVRRNHLREKYAILWLIISIGMIVGFVNETLVAKISEFIGIKYPPTLVFIVGIVCLLLLTLMLSIIDSHQTDRIIKLTQNFAILEEKVNALEKSKKVAK